MNLPPLRRISIRLMAVAVSTVFAVAFVLAGPQDDNKPRHVMPTLDEQKTEMRAFLQQGTSGAGEPPAVDVGGLRYSVLSLEFNNADDCKYFDATQDGVYVLTRFQQFAEIMFQQDDKKAYNKVVSCIPLLRWYDWAADDVAAPPVEPCRTLAPPGIRDVETVVRGDIDGLT